MSIVRGSHQVPCPKGLGGSHEVQCLKWGWGGQFLYNEVQCIMGNGHMVTPLDTDRHTCENITFPQLCWQAVKIGQEKDGRRRPCRFRVDWLLLLKQRKDHVCAKLSDKAGERSVMASHAGYLSDLSGQQTFLQSIVHANCVIHFSNIWMRFNKKILCICHGFVSAGDALGWERPATPMSSFLAGRSGCKWPNTSLLLGRAPLGGAYGRRSLLRSTPTLEGGQRTGACITKWMGG